MPDDTTLTTRELEIIRAACLRHGQSPEEAAEVLDTIVSECAEGDFRLRDTLLEAALRTIH
jgi:hypothetical protein